MSMNFAIRHNKPFPGWLRRYLMTAAMLISLASPAAQANAINIRGMEYGDISLKELVSVYQQAYTKAGFTVTAKVAKDDTHKMKFNMHFLPKDKTKKDKGNLVLALYPLNKTKMPSPTCMPCTVSAEAIDITLYETGSDSVDLEQQMQQARDKADEEIANTLKKHIWYDPVDGVPQYGKLYDKIGVLDFVSTLKEAYTSAGFKFSQEDSTTKLTEDKNREYRQLIYTLVVPDNPKNKGSGRSTVTVYSQKSSYWCEPCTFTHSPDLYASSEGDAESLYSELKTKDQKAREMATAKLAKYLRARPRRDITNDAHK